MLYYKKHMIYERSDWTIMNKMSIFAACVIACAAEDGIRQLLYFTGLWVVMALLFHYGDVIMSAMASQITGVTIVYSTLCSGADKKYQSPASLAFVREFTGDRWIPLTKGQYRGKWSHLMTSSCHMVTSWHGNKSRIFNHRSNLLAEGQ